jgi:type VI protein secretion system component VasK
MLASLILGAHFLRDGHMLFVLLCLLFPFLLLIRRRWVLQLLQGYALVGAFIWAQATYALVQTRIAEGESWTRMLLILAGVTLFTLWAGFLLRSRRLQERYPADSGEPEREAETAPEG